MNDSMIIIDDDNDLLDSISDYFNLKGFNVVGIGRNGLEAVQLYEEYRPNLVLIDISMPNYDGIYGLKHIQRINPDAKVIVLTGNWNESIQQKIKPFNVSTVMRKPCSLGQLEQLLRSIISITDSFYTVL